MVNRGMMLWVLGEAEGNLRHDLEPLGNLSSMLSGMAWGLGGRCESTTVQRWCVRPQNEGWESKRERRRLGSKALRLGVLEADDLLIGIVPRPS